MKKLFTGKVIEGIKTAAVTVLFFLMLILAGLYMIRSQRQSFLDESSLPDGTLGMLLGSDNSSPLVFDSDYIVPAAVAYHVGGGTVSRN